MSNHKASHSNSTIIPLSDSFYSVQGLSVDRLSYQPRVWQTHHETSDDSYPVYDDIGVETFPGEHMVGWNRGSPVIEYDDQRVTVNFKDSTLASLKNRSLEYTENDVTDDRFPNNKVATWKQRSPTYIEKDETADDAYSSSSKSPLYGFSNWNEPGHIGKACFVRLLLIGHNIMTVWRVVEAYNNDYYWIMLIMNILLLFEGQIVIVKRAGVEPSWWCPCFLIYLSTTIPAIWLLQINQYNEHIAGTSLNVDAAAIVTTTTVTGANVTTNDDNLLSDAPIIDNNFWVIIVEESLIYLLVFSRWILPRGKTVSQEFIADLLLEFLAIASDIMELLAVFDEDIVRSDLQLTYVIMTVWSLSFIQFIPIMVHKRRYRHVRSPRIKCITRKCGDKFVEIVVTCMSIFLQDGPFLVVRLYIMIGRQLVTYSLVFFVLKNIVTLILLFYRLVLMCYHLPCSKRSSKEDTEENVVSETSNNPQAPETYIFRDVYDTKEAP